MALLLSNEAYAADGAAAVVVGWKANLPGIALVAGVATILIAMISFKLHAFLALILAAFVVSCFVPGEGSEFILRVATDFGKSCGGIGIVIAMATIIGKCMLDSGSADRVVRAFTSVLGEKRAPEALMGSGFLLGIPVFFDTVFYLLVPLARSFYRQTKKNYLQYLVAIAAGGAVTHTMVPPTPGPLFVAANLNVNLGLMILAGLLIGIPTAFVGLAFAWWCNRWIPVEMRPMGMSSTEPPPPKRPPSLLMALTPVGLPVLLISAATIVTLLADYQQTSRFRSSDIEWPKFQNAIANPASSAIAHAIERLKQSSGLSSDTWDFISKPFQFTEEQQSKVVSALNLLLLDKKFYDAKVFSEIKLSNETKKALTTIGSRQKVADLQHMNRGLLDDLFPEAIAKQNWYTPLRKAAIWIGLPGDPNMALILAALASLGILMYTQGRSLLQLSKDMEEALLSGATIILITAAGGAFGEMLRQVKIDDWIKGYVPDGVSGQVVLALAFVVAAVLKVAQGSSTVAMIVASSTLGAIISPTQIPFNMVYVATTIACGSLVGSWMNDSGFWVFVKMGGLTEKEGLKSWTILLTLLGVTGALISGLLAYVFPMKS